MLSGEFYISSDPELMRERARARTLTRRYNLTTEDELEARSEILRELCAVVGEGVWVEPPFYCDYGSNLQLADGVYMNFGCVILDCAPVTLGKNVLLGPSVQIYTAHHAVSAALRVSVRGGATPPGMASPVSIGDNVWIGGGSIICPGVTIGENTTIGAGSVVAKDIPEGVLAAGNVCRVIRRIS